MKKSREAGNTRTTIVIVVLLCMIATAGLICGGRYISARLLQANEMGAADMAAMVAAKLELTDDEVAYMKSLTFNEMETDPINHRLMEAYDWRTFSARVSNVYLLTPLAPDEIIYCNDQETADFLGYEVGTALNGMWLLNGRIDNGVFVEAQRDNIYRYTALDEAELAMMQKPKIYGTYTSDAWGEFITGYAPIYTKEGSFIGLIGVDMSLDKYQSSAQHIISIMIFVSAVTTLAVTAAFLTFSVKSARARESLHKRKEAKYLQLVDIMGRMDDDTLIAKGHYNLTHNQVVYYRRSNGDNLSSSQDTGYDEMLSRLSGTAVSPDKGDEMRQRFEREYLIHAYQQGQTEGEFEYTRYRSDGTIIWSLVRYNLFEEPDKGDLMMFIYTYDISERMMENHILAKLGETEYDVMGLLDAQTHHYTTKKVQGTVQPDASVMEGDFDEVSAMRIRTDVLPAEQEELLEKLRCDYIVRALERETVFYMTYSVMDGDGHYHRKRYCFWYLDDTRATILYYRSDITERYNREQEQLRRTEDALQQAKEANKAKSAFLSRMSHDIRTPMNTIVNLTKIVQEELDDPEAALEDLKKIDTSNQFLLSLVNDILDMSRIENENIELHPEQYSYREFLNYIDSTFQPLADQKKIQFTLEKGIHDVDIMIDKVRFNQMCANLISNAIKYTPEGGIVCFRMIHGEMAGGILPCDIYVIDNGIGMSREFQTKMFEPFVQEDRAFKTVEGTGLGLTIVKEIVNLLGGTIEVMSEVGVGTTFHVHVDMVLASGAAVNSGEQQIDLSVLQGKRVLLAEDHPLNQEIARRLLAHVGVQVTLANNGQEALEQFRQDPQNFDVILMDMRMPIMDGLEATRAIRALGTPEAGKVPIIAMTANAFTEDREESKEAGLNAHLSKPIEPQLLYRTLGEWICR